MLQLQTEEIMNTSYHYAPNRGNTNQQQRVPSLKRSRSDIWMSPAPSRWIDQDYYLNNVLRISPDTSEDGIDRALKRKADELGLSILQLATNVEAMTSSMSATTIASEPTNQSSNTSQSTAPTSCSSSEVRPTTSSVHKSHIISEEEILVASPTVSEVDTRKRDNGFKRGFRRMTGFSKKKKSIPSPTLSSTSGYPDIDTSIGADNQSITSGVKSPSIKSKESSGLWSNRLSTNEACPYEQPVLVDHDALRRSMECKEMIILRARQLEERQRFLDYQSELVSKITKERDFIKAQKSTLHQQAVHEQMQKNEKLVDGLESRHLEEEFKILKEHEVEKRTVMIRLRYMEAYCQTPSPPPTPSDMMFVPRFDASGNPSPARLSIDSNGAMSPIIAIPERKVTDKDYHSLAQQYRERDAMDNLHASKINVLRGKQKRAVEKFMAKLERKVEDLEQDQQRELDAVDFEFGRREADCRSEFDFRRRRLENRWRLQAKIERKKREDATGLKFESLPDVLCVDNCSVELMLRPTEVLSREVQTTPMFATISVR